MKKFIILSGDNLNGLQGAANFIKLLADEEYWLSKGVQIEIHSNSDSFSDALEYQKTLKYHARLYAKKMLSKTNVGKRLKFFQYDIKVLGAKPVADIGEDISDGDWILLNDVYVADAFYRKYGSSKNTIFMMHNNGKMLSLMKDLLKDKKISKYLKEQEKIILQNATKIVFVSQKAKETFKGEYPDYSNKCLHIYIGLEDKKHIERKNTKNELRFVTVGTVNKRKNQAEIIRAIHEIGNPMIKLTVVGAGEELDTCKKIASKFGLDSQITFVGAQNNVLPYLYDADIFIMSSKDEGLPISAQEAVRAGLPLILTDVGGCSELIRENGILVDKECVGLSSAIKQCYENKEKLIEWGKESRQLYEENFSVDKMRDRYYSVIDGDL